MAPGIGEWMFDQREMHDGAEARSYVDNLELTATSIVEAEQGLALMTQFCQLMDLQLDTAKTYFWSNDAADRAAARRTRRNMVASPPTTCSDSV